MKTSVEEFDAGLRELMAAPNMVPPHEFKALAMRLHGGIFRGSSAAHLEFNALFAPWAIKYDSFWGGKQGSTLTIGHDSLDYAMLCAFWPLLVGPGDGIDIKSAARDFEDAWRSLNRPLDKGAFDAGVALWEHWASDFSVACLAIYRMGGHSLGDDDLCDTGLSWVTGEAVEGLILSWLPDAMWAEVPALAPEVTDDAELKRGRPLMFTRDFLIDRVYGDLATLFMAPSRGGHELADMRRLQRSMAEEDADLGFLRKDFGLTAGWGDFGCRDQVDEVLMWLLPSLRDLSKRSQKALREKAQRKLAGDETAEQHLLSLLTDAERAAIAETEYQRIFGVPVPEDALQKAADHGALSKLLTAIDQAIDTRQPIEDWRPYIE